MATSFLESTEPQIFFAREWLSGTSQFLPTWSWDQAVWNWRTCEQRVQDGYWEGEILLPFVLPRVVDAKLAWRRRERCIYVTWTVSEVLILNLTGWEKVSESDWINFLPSSQIGTWNHKTHVKLWNKLCFLNSWVRWTVVTGKHHSSFSRMEKVIQKRSQEEKLS